MTCQLASLSSYSVGIGPTQFDAKLAEGTLCPAVMSGYHLSSPRMHFKVGILSEFIYGDQYSSEVKFFSLFRTAIPALRPCGHKVRQRTEWAERSQTGVVEDFLELGGGLLTPAHAQVGLTAGVDGSPTETSRPSPSFV